MSDVPKSAIDLVMERLRRKDAEAGTEQQTLTDAQRAAIAEVRSVYEAQVAERKIMHRSTVASVFDPVELSERDGELRRDLDRFGRERDEKIKESGKPESGSTGSTRFCGFYRVLQGSFWFDQSRGVGNGLKNHVADDDQREEHEHTNPLSDVGLHAKRPDGQARDDRPDQRAGDRGESANHSIQPVELADARRRRQPEACRACPRPRLRRAQHRPSRRRCRAWRAEGRGFQSPPQARTPRPRDTARS